MTDPQPIVNAYRVVSFLAAVCAAVLLLDFIPAEVKPWIIVASLVLNLALTVFFKVAPDAPANPSIAARVANKIKPEKEQG